MLDIISATRGTAAQFQSEPLGASLARMSRDPRLRARVAFENSRGLSDVYNGAIEAADASEYLVFVHDDVWIEDFYFADRVIEGLRHFDVVGVAGTTTRYPGQTAWWFVNGKPDARRFLSGGIGHGNAPMSKVTFYGLLPARCELMDGVLLATKRDTLRSSAVRFDSQFTFHFYDIDFCRSARAAGLGLGTWPISMTHRSKGDITAPDLWDAASRAYLAKWGD